VNQKIYPIGFEVGAFSFKVAIGAVLYIGSILLARGHKPLISWSISIVALIIYGGFLMVFAGISIKKIIQAFRYVQMALRKAHV
jgi:hypothetical protein